MPIAGKVEALQKLSLAATKLHTPSLRSKIAELKRSRSPDHIQQLQTDAIVDLYDAVRQIQEAIWPMITLIPDVEAAREAAKGAGAGQIASAQAALREQQARHLQGSAGALAEQQRHAQGSMQSTLQSLSSSMASQRSTRSR